MDFAIQLLELLTELVRLAAAVASALPKTHRHARSKKKGRQRKR